MTHLFKHRNGYYFKRKIPKTQTNFLISLRTDSLKEAKFIIDTITPKFLKLFMENIMNWDEEIDYINDLIGEYVDEAKEDYTKYSRLREKKYSYTTKKGEKLQNHIRSINIIYNEEGELHFIGDSFLPQQVRIMSGYILTNKLKPLEGKYLILYKVNKSDELNALVFTENNEIKIDKVERVEQNSNITIFFVKAKNKAELIGKNGKNIKQMRKEYGNIVVKILL